MGNFLIYPMESHTLLFLTLNLHQKESFLKTIGVKATLFTSPDDLEVKDEDLLSQGSSLA